MRRLKKWAKVAAAGMALGLAGCIAAAVLVGAGLGAGAFVYVNGELQRTYFEDYEKVWPACRPLLDRMEFPVDDSRKDATEAHLTGHKADGTAVNVYVRNEGPKKTLVGIRIGTMGDKALSEKMHDDLGKALGLSETGN